MSKAKKTKSKPKGVDKATTKKRGKRLEEADLKRVAGGGGGESKPYYS